MKKTISSVAGVDIFEYDTCGYSSSTLSGSQVFTTVPWLR